VLLPGDVLNCRGAIRDISSRANSRKCARSFNAEPEGEGILAKRTDETQPSPSGSALNEFRCAAAAPAVKFTWLSLFFKIPDRLPHGFGNLHPSGAVLGTVQNTVAPPDQGYCG
jgi:hypothetical protein